MYCSQVLAWNFFEFQSTEQAIEEIADDYGYLSDSDLEDDEDEGIIPPNHATNLVAAKANRLPSDEKAASEGMTMRGELARRGCKDKQPDRSGV